MSYLPQRQTQVRQSSYIFLCLVRSGMRSERQHRVFPTLSTPRLSAKFEQSHEKQQYGSYVTEAGAPDMTIGTTISCFSSEVFTKLDVKDKVSSQLFVYNRLGHSVLHCTPQMQPAHFAFLVLWLPSKVCYRLPDQFPWLPLYSSGYGYRTCAFVPSSA